MLPTPVRTFVWSILVLIRVVLAPSVAAQGTGPDTSEADVGGLLFSHFVFPLLLLLHKLILVRQVKKSMYAVSQDVESELPSVLEVPERAAPAQPRILEFDVTDELPAAVEHREKMIAQALKDLKHRWRSGFIACVVYIALLGLIGFWFFQNIRESPQI